MVFVELRLVDQALNEIIKKYKKVEILINNAGIIRDKSFLKMSEAEIDIIDGRFTKEKDVLIEKKFMEGGIFYKVKKWLL